MQEVIVFCQKLSKAIVYICVGNFFFRDMRLNLFPNVIYHQVFLEEFPENVIWTEICAKICPLKLATNLSILNLSTTSISGSFEFQQFSNAHTDVESDLLTSKDQNVRQNLTGCQLN